MENVGPRKMLVIVPLIVFQLVAMASVIRWKIIKVARWTALEFAAMAWQSQEKIFTDVRWMPATSFAAMGSVAKERIMIFVKKTARVWFAGTVSAGRMKIPRLVPKIAELPVAIIFVRNQKITPAVRGIAAIAGIRFVPPKKKANAIWIVFQLAAMESARRVKRGIVPMIAVKNNL